MNDSNPPARSAGPAPLRRPGSIRRTSTIDTDSAGIGQPMRTHGIARDLVTPRTSEPAALAEDVVDILASPTRRILEIKCRPLREKIASLIGCQAGGRLRAALLQQLPEEFEVGSPLCLLLDDFTGASLVAPSSWSEWHENWQNLLRDTGAAANAGRHGLMVGVCAGFRAGSSALTVDGGVNHSVTSRAPVEDLVNPDDPLGWHVLPEQMGMGVRRARRMDVWLDGETVHIDAGFQDSSTLPSGGRRGVHEYRVRATATLAGFKLLTIVVDPRILPFRECIAAAPNPTRLVGAPLNELRWRTLEVLSGVDGCTHLNDVIRCMADVPQLVSSAHRKME